jgi:NADPH:quinone reductase-like Zn-dependent oxidoreductase
MRAAVQTRYGPPEVVRISEVEKSAARDNEVLVKVHATTVNRTVTYQEAAPSTEGTHYALAHIRAAKVHSGQDVLVYGATGAIGSAAVQLLKSLGANAGPRQSRHSRLPRSGCR